MKVKNLYVHKFSKLEYGIQSSKTVYYNICYDKMFGIQVVEKMGTTVYEDTVYISEDEDVVINIIEYLYENAVDVALFKNVIEDLLERLSV